MIAAILLLTTSYTAELTGKMLSNTRCCSSASAFKTENLPGLSPGRFSVSRECQSLFCTAKEILDAAKGAEYGSSFVRHVDSLAVLA